MASADSPQTVSGGNSSLRDRIVTAARHWFRPPSGHDQRTEAQLESERWLLRRSGLGPRFERLHIVLPCVLIQACCGVIYSWSVFNAPMDENVWGTPGCNASAFLVSVAAYGASTVTFGAFVGRAGPFASVARTVLFTPLSWVLAAVASRIGSLWLLILGYGLCAGVGTAHGYLATTSAMQKWFPEKRGFASGVAVAGFGIGAFSASLLGKSLLDPKGPHRMSVPAVQGVFAGLLFSILLLSWPVLRLPPPGWAPPHAQAHSHPAAVPVEAAASAGEHAGTSIAAPAAVVALAPAAPAPAASGPAWLPSWLRRKPRDPSDDSVGPDRKYTLLSAIASFEFIALAVVVFGNSMPGVVALSSLADMTMYTFSMDAGTAGTIAALQNLINFSGRFSWGYISDLTGRRPFFVFASLAQVAAVAALPACIRAQNFPLWSLCMLTIASLYGGIFGSLPPAALELFGSDLAAATHGILIAQWALSAVVGIPIFTAVVAAHTVTVPAPSGVGTVRHATPEAYALNAQWLLVMPIVASIAALLLTTNRRDRILSKALRQLRVKCWRRTLVIKLVNDAQADEEWREFMAERHSHAHSHPHSHAHSHAHSHTRALTTTGSEVAAAVDVPVAVAVDGGIGIHAGYDRTPLQGPPASAQHAGHRSDYATEASNPWEHAGQSHVSVEAIPATSAEGSSWTTAQSSHHASSALPVGAASQANAESQEWR